VPGPKPRPDLFRRLNRVLLVVSCGLLFLAILGAFSIWFLSRPAVAGEGEWEPVQRAVPRLVSPLGTGSGFVTEIDGRLWLMTSYGNIEGVAGVKAVFHEPRSGAPDFSIELPTESALVHESFAAPAGTPGAWDIAALDIELWRPQLAGVGIEPLAIGDGGGLRVGAPVVALGHPGAVSGPGTMKSDDLGIVNQSLVKGVVSMVRTEEDRPRRIATDARIGPGYRGGPLVLESSAEVVAVNCGQDAASADRAEGLFPALAADRIPELVDSGVPLSVIRGRISAASISPLPAGVEHPETAWSRFSLLEERWMLCRDQGWEWIDSVIRGTGDDGKDRLVHAVEGGGPRQVAVLVFPESPLVTLDMERFGPTGGTAAGERSTAAGTPIFAEARDPLSGSPSVVTGGSDVSMELSARFLGKPIRARYVAVLVQRVLGTRPLAPRAILIPSPTSPVAPLTPIPEPSALAVPPPVSHRSGTGTPRHDFPSRLQGI
jgi:S1-C subfamily serine protease